MVAQAPDVLVDPVPASTTSAVRRACPVCAGTGSETVFEMDRDWLRQKHAGIDDMLECVLDGRPAIEVVQCVACDMVFVRDLYELARLRARIGTPLDAPLDLAAMKREHRGLPPERFFAALHVTQTMLRHALSDAGKPARFLDFGAGQVGIHARIAQTYGPSECTVFDPIVRSGMVDGILFENDLARVRGRGPFDVVVAKECLEHALHPAEALKDIFALLRPGGFAFVSVPLVRYAALARFLGEARTGRGTGGKDVHIGHLNYFSAPLIVRLIREAGFTIVPRSLHTTHYKSTLGSPGMWRWRLVDTVRLTGFGALARTRWFPDWSAPFIPGFILQRPTGRAL